MSPTLLLDLDDTLLKNNIDDFLPHYLQAFATEVKGTIEPGLFVRSLMAGTRAMVNNRQPDCTLKEVFESVFYPLVNINPFEFQKLANRFYEQVFPSLQRFTEPIPEAEHVIQQALKRGYQLAITTAPLFPARAVIHRLTWSKLSPDNYPFELVTSYEKFHFAKPDPAFFAEALGLLGWPEGPVVVVGDDLEKDIHPGQILGLPAFWVASSGIEKPIPPNHHMGFGDIADLLDWMDSAPPETLLPAYDKPESFLAILRATPAVLDNHVRMMDSDQWNLQPGEGEWSLTEILCHLRDVDQEVNLPRLKRVIQHQNPFIPGEDTDRWAEERAYPLQEGGQAFQQFVVTRMKLVELLESLSPLDWDRPARHAIFGPTHLKELVSFIAAHDRLHLQQVHALHQTIAPGLGSETGLEFI